MESFNPNKQPDKDELRSMFVGKHLNELPTPMAVIDRRLVQAHCQKMLATCKALGVKFRPHVKTHKTIEGTALQLGPSPSAVNIVVSTLSEAEWLTPLLLTHRSAGTPINVLYSMPLPPSTIPRLARLSSTLGPSSLSIMIDHPTQLSHLQDFRTHSAPPPLIFLKIDVGYHRAGLSPSDPALQTLIDAALAAHSSGLCVLHGVYSHDSNSYSSTSAHEGMKFLNNEIENLKSAAETIWSRPSASSILKDRKLVCSVGATPDATAAQNLVLGDTVTASASPEARKLIELLRSDERMEVELHAGVYPFLDMQQLRTQAVPAPVINGDRSAADAGAEEVKVEGGLEAKDVAFTVLAEVASVYPGRDPPQALVNAGCIALGREPCLGYSGMGTVTDWGVPMVTKKEDGGKEESGSGEERPLRKSGWVVGKISQEHGILWNERDAGVEGGLGRENLDLGVWEVGRKVRVLPNHACIAGAGFGFYVVVDGGDKVVDVWVRCRGW
ncbi:MAG: hypothetical protein MMC23_007093 [Stictis urceolatum]|nr:hypothetical protein [Stictis urceolata]